MSVAIAISPRDTGRVSPAADPAEPEADLLKAVAEAYGLQTPISAERLTGGFANDVFLLTDDPLVVLHIKHPPLDLQSLSWEHELLALLRPHLPETPAPMRTLGGRTFLLNDERPVWLTPYVPGEPAEPADRRAVAAALGRLHAVQLKVEPRPGHPRLRDTDSSAQTDAAGIRQLASAHRHRPDGDDRVDLEDCDDPTSHRRDHAQRYLSRQRAGPRRGM